MWINIESLSRMEHGASKCITNSCSRTKSYCHAFCKKRKSHASTLWPLKKDVRATMKNILLFVFYLVLSQVVYGQEVTGQYRSVTESELEIVITLSNEGTANIFSRFMLLKTKM